MFYVVNLETMTFCVFNPQGYLLTAYASETDATPFKTERAAKHKAMETELQRGGSYGYRPASA